MIKNIMKEFDAIEEYWSPKIIADINDSYVKIAKVKGEFVWHDHEKEDELFHVLKGTLIIKYEASEVVLNENDMHVVPKGVKHFPMAKEETWIMLIEKKTTAHTGDVVSPLTKSLDVQNK